MPEALRAYAHLVLHRVHELAASVRRTGTLDVGRADAIARDLETLTDRADRAVRQRPPGALPAVVQARAHINDALHLVLDLVTNVQSEP